MFYALPLFFCSIHSLQAYNHGFHIQPRPLDWYQTTKPPAQLYFNENQRQNRFIDFNPEREVPPHYLKHFPDYSNEDDTTATENKKRQTFFRNQNSPGFSWPSNDNIVFGDDFDTTTKRRPTSWYDWRRPSTERTTTVAVPGMETTQTPCEDRCQTTRQYNPACGNDGTTYYNQARLHCAQKCGKRVSLLHLGRCSTPSFR